MSVVQGMANEKFVYEQKAMLAKLGQSAGSNSATIGASGEILILEFLKRYLPPQLLARKGHYRKINGELSREIDVMILDARFPFLNEIENGVVYAMQHSVVAVIEVKRTLGGDEICKIREHTIKLEADDAESPQLARLACRWEKPTSHAIAFRSESKLDTLAAHFFKNPMARCYFHILDHGFECREGEKNSGAMMYVEGERHDCIGVSARTRNPLSDFYYMLLENCFWTVSIRKINDSLMGDIIRSYYNWSNDAGSFKNHRFS
jgi:hypothetical protein